ncbi:MAPEG family protein [Cognaticolwellia mytili]|uniref:MAPEG family protein n=1 Tax=Cognaticolwellia mytili TaxID=1888913 RepID=UPI001F1D150D|nr:MAPEG family protein [Cognaticolwellia mytili]
MITLSLTGLYASLLGILYIGLTINIIRLRRRFKIGIGTGQNDILAKAIRVHGNFSEYVPLALILLGIYELNNASSVMLHALGSILVLARALHVVGLNRTIGISKQRVYGMLLTFLVILVLAVENIRLFVIGSIG